MVGIRIGVFASGTNRPVPCTTVRNQCVIGVDLGGTNVRACAYYEDGTEAGSKVEISSQAQNGTEAILNAVVQSVSAAKGTAEHEPVAVGLSIPGHIDDDAGVVRWSPNFGHYIGGFFKYWEDVQVREPLEASLKLPIVMGNDANLAALGEYRFGSGRDHAKCFVLITIGTGIGSGVVLAPGSVTGRSAGPLLLLGGNKGGAELGHIVIQHGGLDPNSGEYGSIEGYCQRDAIIKRAVNRLRRGVPSLLNELSGQDWTKVTPAMLSAAADRGDELSIDTWAEVGTYLGIGIGSLINVFAPDVFAVGGQIAKAGRWLLDPARKAARNSAIPSLFKDTTILQAEQVDDAGMLGGAVLAFQSLDR